MTVEQLISRLQEFPSNLSVKKSGDTITDGFLNIEDIVGMIDLDSVDFEPFVCLEFEDK